MDIIRATLAIYNFELEKVEERQSGVQYLFF